MMKGFQGAAARIPLGKYFNGNMNHARITVEWTFGKNYGLWPWLDFEKQQKCQRQATEADWEVYFWLSQCHTCCYGSNTSRYFNCEPPELKDYLDYQC